MKTTITNLDTPTIEYPCLKIRIDSADNNKYIVLFKTASQGMVISADPNSKFEIGAYSDDWNYTKFVPFNGRITLEN